MEIRRRKREICNKIHNSTWVIETLGLLIATIFQLLALRTDPYLANSVSELIGVFITRLLVPFTCLFAESQIKIIVLKYGWVSAIKAALKFKHFSPVIPLDGNRGSVPLGSQPSMNRQNVKDRNNLSMGDAELSVKKNELVPSINAVRTLSIPVNSNFSTNPLPNSVPDEF